MLTALLTRAACEMLEHGTMLHIPKNSFQPSHSLRRVAAVVSLLLVLGCRQFAFQRVEDDLYISKSVPSLERAAE